MPMKILIVEPNPDLSGAYRDMLKRLVPDARIDVVVSVGRYVNDFANTEYDVCIMSDIVHAGRSAFSSMAPQLKSKFPGTAILCNSGLKSAEDAEKHAGMELFARGQNGSILIFNKHPYPIAEFVSMIVMPKGEMKRMHEPRRISAAPAAEPQRRNSAPPRA
jgi:hypothetical protein